MGRIINGSGGMPDGTRHTNGERGKLAVIDSLCRVSRLDITVERTKGEDDARLRKEAVAGQGGGGCFPAPFPF